LRAIFSFFPFNQIAYAPKELLLQCSANSYDSGLCVGLKFNSTNQFLV